jgi:hypothetical protein
MRFCFGSLVVLCLVVCSTVFGQTLTLSTDGKTDYMIVVPTAASVPETTAARELQEHLGKVTGATLKIVPEEEAAIETPQIVIGPSARMKQLVPDVDVSTLGPDGILLKTVGKNLVLAGQSPRGTLYAVYTFLEDVVGCRWWTSTENFVPQKPTLTIPTQNVQYAPKLRYREAFYRDAIATGVFAARCKCNGNQDPIPPEYGGRCIFCNPGFVHTFYLLLPPDKYFAQYPEWYSEIGGHRTHDNGQLCLSNEAMRKELVRNALTLLRQSPDSSYISISQNDCGGPCECPECKAIEKEEGAPSGLLLRFVNAVAADIEKEFPHVLVDTLAYRYTRQPPAITRPRSNVVVRLCSIECSFAQPLTSPTNDAFRKDIVGWSKIAPQLFVWDYVTNFSNYLLPHPNCHVVAPNIRFFVDHHTIGLFEQGDVGCAAGDFVRLRAWVIAHLLWNPDLDPHTLTQDFIRGYYGAAAPYVQAYRDLIDAASERCDKFVGCYTDCTSRWLGLEDLNKATRLFDQAQQAVADDPVARERVRRDRLPLDYTWLTRYDALRRVAAEKHLEFLGPQNPQVACETFIRQAKDFGVEQFAEGRLFAEHINVLQRYSLAPAAPPELCKDLPQTAWIDLQDCRFRLAGGGLSAIVDDALASDGKTARMPGDHLEWAVEYHVSGDVASAGPWHCYAAVRAEAKAKDGVALQTGIYDENANKYISNRNFSVGEIVGADYHVVDLGTHELTSTTRLWFAPPKRPGEVDAVYIDRIFLIHAR